MLLIETFYEPHQKKRGGEPVDWTGFIPAAFRPYASGGGGYAPSTLMAAPQSLFDATQAEQTEDTQSDKTSQSSQKEEASKKDDGKSHKTTKHGSKHKKETNSSGNEDDFDWRSFVPPAYRIYIPSEETIKEANKNNTEDKPVDYERFVPEPFRHFTTPQTQPFEGNQPSPSSKHPRQESEKEKEHPSQKHKQESEKEKEKEKSGHHGHHGGKESEKEKEHKKHRGHHKHDDKDKSSKKQHGKGQQTEMDTTLESASLLAIPSTSTHSLPIWSTFGIILVSLTCVVGFIVSLYIFNRLKKRHCDYEEVSELDADRLLYV